VYLDLVALAFGGAAPALLHLEGVLHLHHHLPLPHRQSVVFEAEGQLGRGLVDRIEVLAEDPELVDEQRRVVAALCIEAHDCTHDRIQHTHHGTRARE
jgi:hypothetical protein